ncbi:MAG: monovalent cation:proton antiporter-2 (CPA2) family protein [Alphaproteobacteria bacterium]|nr:monovalent cation:proton antiporter-2 (CPA2) family protein [Alphaproteobacteria bacterium]
MQHSIHLTEIVILLSAAVLMVGLFRALKLSPVLGYLVAGTAIGPYGFSLISDVGPTAGFAEFGIVFLLFLIGLELSFERLRSMRKHVFGFGSLQVIITALMIGALFTYYNGNIEIALIIGGGLALSSTAIVLQVLAEQNEKASQVGRLALAALILQDLAVIPLLVFVTALGSNSGALGEALGTAAAKAVIGLAIIFILGRLVLRPLFRFIASLEHTELFTATTIFVVLGVAWLTHSAGLSAALGAFMAGLLVAETEFKHQVEADILPFKGLLLGLFFMTVGMSLNVSMLLDQFISIIGLTVALMAAKAFIIIVLCRAFNFSLGSSIHAGLLLSQGGEFAFVLFSLAGEYNLIPVDLNQILLVTVTVSMALTPLAAELGNFLAHKLEKQTPTDPQHLLEETLDLSQHVIICGYGRVGHTVSDLLENENISYVAIDMDSYMVSRERKIGTPVYYGDSARAHVLSALGIKRARALIITHSDTRVALQTIATVRDLNNEIPIIARAKNLEQVQKLERAGATLAVAEMFEVSLQMGGALLKSIGINELEINRIIDIFRAEDYALTRTAEETGVGS